MGLGRETIAEELKHEDVNTHHNGAIRSMVPKNGKDHFVLITAYGQVTGTTQVYSSLKAREAGVSSVVKNAPNADITEG